MLQRICAYVLHNTANKLRDGSLKSSSTKRAIDSNTNSLVSSNFKRISFAR